MQFRLCELISLSAATEQPAGSAPCQAPTNVCSGQFQDRQTVPELGTHVRLAARCGEDSGSSEVSKGILFAVTNSCHIFVSKLGIAAGVPGVVRQHPA